MEIFRIPAQVDKARFKADEDQLEAKYGLPLEVKFCKVCVMSNQKPNSALEYLHTKETTKKTIKKVLIDSLEDRYYIVANLYNSIIDTDKFENPGSDEARYESFNELMNDFVTTNIYKPTSSSIYKDTTNLPGGSILSIKEDIDDTITLHWFVIHKRLLKEYIQETFLNDI